MTIPIKTENTCTLWPLWGVYLSGKRCIRMFIGALLAFGRGWGWRESTQKEQKKGRDGEGKKRVKAGHVHYGLSYKY